MLTGRKFLLLALVVGLCALTTTGCKRRRSGSSTTNNTSGIFTTDNFPGGSVQDGNVSDDQRAFSTSTDDFNGGTLVCTHNGERGTIMVTYGVSDQLFASYYDGSSWTRGVALRHFDTHPSSIDQGEVIHAFVNTGNDDRGDASDRDGDCLIFWNATDFDSDGTGPDDENQCEYVSYFDVSHASEEELNHGFDIDPSNPGFYEANRISSLDDAGEDVAFQGLVTDGLCGEARWTDGANVYTYGNETFAIFVFYHQLNEKSPGVFDDVTIVNGFDLDLVVDEEFPLTATLDFELGISTFGASDSGASSRESSVNLDYSSYNDLLFYNVISNTGSSFGGGFYDGDFDAAGGTIDISLQYTFFNFSSFTLSNDDVDSVGADSDAVDIDQLAAEWLSMDGVGFLGGTGLNTYGRDEGLSCFVTFFGEAYDPDTGTGAGIYSEEGSELHCLIAEVDEDTGFFLNTAEIQQVDFNDVTIVDNVDDGFGQAQISRNGDYIWVTYNKPNSLGGTDDENPEYAEYLTTRLDSDDNPVAIPLLTTTLGVPFIYDVEDGQDYYDGFFQDNLGYICGFQSDPFEMHHFWIIADNGTGDSLIYTVTLTADVDGVVGGEVASSALLLIDEDNSGYYEGIMDFAIDTSRAGFNATDAGQDGDIFYAFTFDDFDTDGISDVFIDAGRFGVTSAASIIMGSGTSTRQAEYGGGQTISLISTPPGQDINTFDVGDASYGNGADHGPDRIHLVFREAETASYPISTGGNTETGYALRTREYRPDTSSGVFGDDFIPNAGTAFAVPFDLDLPFIDPNTGDDAEVQGFEVCGDSVTIIFLEAGHLYYQEFSSNNDNVGWRQSADLVSDPALIDDDSPELVSSVEEICEPACTCCNIDGTAIFWVKALNVTGSDIDRVQVRIINRDDNN